MSSQLKLMREALHRKEMQRAHERELAHEAHTRQRANESIWETIPRLGKAVAKGAYQGLRSMGEAEALNEAKVYNPEFAEKMENAFQRRAHDEAEEQEDYGTGERIAHKVGQFVGGALPIGGGGAASTIPSLLKGVGRNIGHMAGVGATAGTLRELGVPEPIADIGTAIATPFASKNVLRNFTPAGMAEASVRKAVRGLPAKEGSKSLLIDQPDAHLAINISENMKPFKKTFTPEKSGARLENGLRARLEHVEGMRRRPTQPLYDAVSRTEMMSAPKTRQVIEEELKHLSASKPHHKEIYSELYGKDLTKLEKKHAHLGKAALEHIKFAHEPTFSQEKFHNELKKLKTQRRLDPDLRRETHPLKTAMQEELYEAVPQTREADRLYKELSPPVNEIMESKIFGPLLKEGAQFTPREVTTKIIEPALKDPTHAKEVIKQFWSPQHKEMLKRSVNYDLMHHILEESGNIRKGSIYGWQKKNPGAALLYPDLDKKLKSLANARYLATELTKRAHTLPFLEVAENLPMGLIKRISSKLGHVADMVPMVQEWRNIPQKLRTNLVEKILTDPTKAEHFMKPIGEIDIHEWMRKAMPMFAAAQPRD